MTYSIIETISIIFIVLGVLLAISAVVTFYTKNIIIYSNENYK